MGGHNFQWVSIVEFIQGLVGGSICLLAVDVVVIMFFVVLEKWRKIPWYQCGSFLVGCRPGFLTVTELPKVL
jgi:hypothetical protein